jgi:hypothetical protein
MKIRFETTIEDIVAWNRFHFEHSPALRRQRWIVTLLIPGIVGVMAWSDYQAKEESVLWMYALAFSTFWCVGIQFLLPWRTAQNVRKLLAEGSNHSVLGWREIELVNNRLVEKMALIDSSYDLRAIEKIVSNGDYTFVYISSIQAIPIPMRLYPEEEYRAFVAELRDAWENRDELRPVKATAPDERIVERPV